MVVVAAGGIAEVAATVAAAAAVVVVVVVGVSVHVAVAVTPGWGRIGFWPWMGAGCVGWRWRLREG